MKHIVSLCFFILASGCATSFEELGSKIDKTLNTTPSKKQSGYTLTVQAQPSDSIIKIMNIKPKYHDGIVLQVGTYDILVQRKGYKSYRKYIKVSDKDVVKKVTLKLAPVQEKASIAVTTKQSVQNPTQTKSATKSDVVAEPVAQRDTSQKSEAKSVVTLKPKQVSKKKKPTQAKENKNIAGNTKRVDYLPPALLTPSQFEPAEMTKDEQPKFNGAYIKTIDKGFFSDTVELIEMQTAPTYKSVLFRADKGESISKIWLLKQKQKQFSLDITSTISLPVEKFQGIIVKGEQTELISLHPAERWVRGFDKNGSKAGATAVMFNSNKHVNRGEPLYIVGKHSKVKMAKVSNDSHFIDFKQPPKKGLYIAWINSNFWFFNLI